MRAQPVFFCQGRFRASSSNVLAYRHLFHAGNFADVFKHSVVVLLAALITRKDKPFLYLDTHAGIARYDLSLAWAQKNRPINSCLMSATHSLCAKIISFLLEYTS